ncbi:40S ribosomal protein S19 [Astathelohania contejeani]|uniref:40S ribosomal protein S19 n=1 Tax=Astathelohania contejeani TaxID=164912 RepID=A0ABQ7HXR2_9MICR|nr:40S ribosomal protein S19 [Thelohania contejeani]
MKLKVLDVAPAIFISNVSEHLKSNDKVELPIDHDIIKTGSGREMPPMNKDWYYIRSASIVRLLCRDSLKPSSTGLTVKFFAKRYGNIKNRGVRPNKHVPADAKIITKILNDLKKSNWVVEEDGKYKLSSLGIEELHQIIEKMID